MILINYIYYASNCMHLVYGIILILNKICMKFNHLYLDLRRHSTNVYMKSLFLIFIYVAI